MKIEHIAIWVSDLEATKGFYEKYFNAKPNTLYHNKAKEFISYFLSFGNGCRLELMHRPDVSEQYKNYEKQTLGLIHFAISVGSKEKVDSLTNQLRTMVLLLLASQEQPEMVIMKALFLILKIILWR